MESLAETRAKCSGAKVGMPPNLNFLPGTVMVSPIEKDARVEHANDIACVSLFHNFPLSGHELLGLAQAHFFIALDVEDLCVALELAGADTHEGQTVAVGLVHVCLNFEHKRGKVRAEGIHHPAVCHPGGRGAGSASETPPGRAPRQNW